ncbi:unnamed protein product, partial [Mesorhabditis spiculigera]
MTFLHLILLVIYFCFTFSTEIHDLQRFPNSQEVPQRCRATRKVYDGVLGRICGQAFSKAYQYSIRRNSCTMVTNPNTCLKDHQFRTQEECERMCKVQD